MVIFCRSTGVGTGHVLGGVWPWHCNSQLDGHQQYQSWKLKIRGKRAVGGLERKQRIDPVLCLGDLSSGLREQTRIFLQQGDCGVDQGPWLPSPRKNPQRR